MIKFLDIERKQMAILNNLENAITPPYDYNPNALVTYKSINKDEVSYPVVKVTQLEWELEQKRSLENRIQAFRADREQIIEKLSVDGWYGDDWSKSEILNQLCLILGHEPTKHVRIVADVRMEIDYEIPLGEAEDFEARDFLQDNLSVESYHGNLEVDLFEVQSAEVYED